MAKARKLDDGKKEMHTSIAAMAMQEAKKVEIEVEEETMNCIIQEIEEMSLSNNAHKLVNTNYIVKLFV